MIKLRLWEDFPRACTHVVIYNESNDGERMVLTYQDGIHVWEPWHRATEPPSTYVIDEEFLGMLYKELQKKFGDASSSLHAERQDFEREQYRVDKLMDAITQIALDGIPETETRIVSD